jgi:hypothetical protein
VTVTVKRNISYRVRVRYLNRIYKHISIALTI